MDARSVAERIAKLKIPIIVIMSSVIVVLVAVFIILSNHKRNEDSGFYEGVQVHLSTESGFGITAEHAQEIYDMQRAEDLRTQLLHSSHIEDAVVSVSTGEASPFRTQENENEAMVSVILTITDTHTLSDSESEAIKNLIRGTVRGIKDENISITQISK